MQSEFQTPLNNRGSESSSAGCGSLPEDGFLASDFLSNCLSARRSSLGRFSLGRSSLSHSPLGRRSMERLVFSPEKMSHKDCFGDLVLDSLNDWINKFDELDQGERDNLLNDLNCLVFAKSENEVEEVRNLIAERFQLATSLNSIIISATTGAIAEDELQDAHEKKLTPITRRGYWRQVIGDSIERVKLERNHRCFNLGYVHDIIMDCIISLVKTLAEEKGLKLFARSLDVYLKFKLAQENTDELLFECSNDDHRLSELLLALQSQDSITIANFDPIDAETYVRVNLEKRTKEKECQNLKEILPQQLSELGVVEFLKKSNIKDKKKYIDQRTEKLLQLDNDLVEAREEITQPQRQIHDIVGRHQRGENQRHSASITKKLLKIPLDLLHTDEHEKTALDLALQLAVKAKNFSIVEPVLNRARQDGVLKELVIHSLKKMLSKFESVIDLSGMFYLAIQKGCLFDVDLVADIRAHSSDQLSRRISFEPPSLEVLEFSILFDRKNHFVLSPELLNYAMENADAEKFQLLMENILSQTQEDERQDILKSYLEKAVEFGRCAHITKILTCANRHKCAELIWQETLLKENNNEEHLANLIAGAYFAENFDDTFPKLLSKHRDNLTLSQPQLTLISKKLLEFAEGKALAYFIREAGTGSSSWPHNTENRAQEVRDELQKRYVGENKPILPSEVKDALQDNWNVKQNADKLATYYDTATRHAVDQYQSNPAIYTAKATTISQWVQHITQNGETVSLTQKANDVANLLCLDDSIIQRRPWSLPDPHPYNRTQRLVNAGREKLDEKPTMWSRASAAISSVMGWSHQRDKDILEKSNDKMEDYLTLERLNEIPITNKEKNDHTERAVLARGAFKKTLEYLENHADKKAKMDVFLHRYINREPKTTGGFYEATDLVKDLKQASQRDGELGARIGWKMWTSKTGRILQSELKTSAAFLIQVRSQ